MAQTTNQRILIIDDEAELARLTTKILKAAGYEIECHDRLEGAMEKIREFRPALVLLDIFLPDGSGIDLFERLRASPETRRLPVIFFSATAKMEGERLSRLKPEGLIAKPYEIATLVGTVKEALSAAAGKGR